MNQSPGKLLKNSGWLATFLIVLYCLFKTMHWPGSGVMLMLSSALYVLFYLPLWFKSEYKREKRPLLFVQFFTFSLTIIFLLFKSMHWPGGGALFDTWWYYGVFILTPLGFYLLFKAGKKSITDFHIIISFFLMGTLIWGGIGSGTSATRVMGGSFSKNEKELRQSIERTTIKTQRLYKITEQDSFKIENPDLYKRVVVLNSITKSTITYLRDLRNHIISYAEQISETAADSLAIKDVNQNANMGLANELICGWGPTPKEGKFTGVELKGIINLYRDSIVQLLEGENKTFISGGFNLDTDPIVYSDGETVDWVMATFKDVPLGAALLTIENLTYEIRNAESQVLSDIINTAAKKSGTNMAAKIAEMGLVYDNEAKQSDIEELKNQQELTQSKMQSKNEELNAKGETIGWFVFAFIGFIILTVYIVRSNIIRKRINKQLEAQKQEIEIKNKEITDSINYAKRIQQAILPPLETVYKKLPDSFILYKPKDVVSGDFYAFIEKENDILIAAADCTGHGVPGAFMSMIGNEQLSKIIVEKNITQPATILDELHKGIRNALKQDQSTGETRDGMDIVLCKLNLQKLSLEYSGANRPLWIIRENKLLETKADKQPIGGLEADYRKAFTNHNIQLQKGDCVYLFTDGFADQFGGDKGKKLMVKNFEKLLLSISEKTMSAQHDIIKQRYETWKGNNEQVDDVLVIGIKV